MGVFVVWLPAVIVSTRLAKDFKQKDFWKAALRGCPPWMRWLTYTFFGYAIVNFTVSIMTAPAQAGGGPANRPVNADLAFSGHWMAFYAAAAAILYSAIVVYQQDPARRCPSGHPVSPAAVYCEACGERIDRLKNHTDRGM